MEVRQWAEAECLARLRVDWERQYAASSLIALPEALDTIQRNTVRELAVSLEQLAIVLREQSKAECVVPSQEAISLYQQIGDRVTEAISAFNLGHAYQDIPAIRNLAQAEHWYRRSLELYDDRDKIGRGNCLGQLGSVAYGRFIEARATKQSDEELLRFINTSIGFYQQALDLFPSNAVDRLAVVYCQLGNIYQDAGDLDRALLHYREAIRYFDAAGDLFNSATARFNVAVTLTQAGRLPDALAYAQAALRNYATFGDRAAAEIQRTQALIEWIERAMRGGGG
jgi:tetratricopeptide (TPR) repeat protein